MKISRLLAVLTVCLTALAFTGQAQGTLTVPCVRPPASGAGCTLETVDYASTAESDSAFTSPDQGPASCSSCASSGTSYTTSSGGNCGEGLTIDATGDYVQVESRGSVAESTGDAPDDFTICFDYKEAAGGQGGNYCRFFDLDGSPGFRFRRYGSDTTFRLEHASSTIQFTASTNIFDGSWHTICITWTGADSPSGDETRKIYFDGVSQVTNTDNWIGLGGSLVGVSDEFTFGNDADKTTGGCYGTYDNLMMEHQYDYSFGCDGPDCDS